ncbi:hypothetical protein Tco_1091801 [Tanacetum coccineum]|uniref:Retrotransposon gag domain-containing protein n=1 Tax=Tanacetum coccineum TaxID=301880 RepID=A0ABQ5I865_9ASTR
MSTYLKHIDGYIYKQLKGKSFDEIQKLFDKEMKRVNTFVAMGSKVQENKEKKEEGREETAKVEEEKKSEEVEKDDDVELKKLLVIKKDEDIEIDAIPLATILPVIIDYKLHKEGLLVHYELIRADGSSKRYSSMIRMLQGIDREDLEALWRIVKAKYGDTRPENEFERVLYGDLKVMFEPDIKSDVWRMLQGYRVTIWKLIDSSGVHFVRILEGRSCGNNGGNYGAVMSKTRADYRSGVARPKIEDKDNFELKGQFLKELQTNTFSGSDHKDANEHIEKVLKIVDRFHIPNITIDQVMLRAFLMSLTEVASRWIKDEPTGLITTWDGLKTKFQNKYCPPAQTAKKMEEINNFHNF